MRLPLGAREGSQACQKWAGSQHGASERLLSCLLHSLRPSSRFLPPEKPRSGTALPSPCPSLGAADVSLTLIIGGGGGGAGGALIATGPQVYKNPGSTDLYMGCLCVCWEAGLASPSLPCQTTLPPSSLWLLHPPEALTLASLDDASQPHRLLPLCLAKEPGGLPTSPE